MPTLPVLFPAAAQSSIFMFIHVSATHRGATLLKKAVYRFLKRCLCFYNTVATVWFAETCRVENICVQEMKCTLCVWKLTGRHMCIAECTDIKWAGVVQSV